MLDKECNACGCTTGELPDGKRCHVCIKHKRRSMWRPKDGGGFEWPSPYSRLIKKGVTMKKLVLISVLTGGLLLAPQAQAINEEWAAALGFIGGVLVAKSSDYDRETRVVVREEIYHIERPVMAYRPRRRHCDRTEIAVPSGYYEIRTERYWIPGRRIITRDHCGRKAIRYTQGYYDYREIKVWVEYR